MMRRPFSHRADSSSRPSFSREEMKLRQCGRAWPRANALSSYTSAAGQKSPKRLPGLALISDADESIIGLESTILRSTGQSTVAQIECERKLRIPLAGANGEQAGGVTHFHKTRQPAALGFIGVYRQRRKAASARVRDVVGATA